VPERYLTDAGRRFARLLADAGPDPAARLARGRREFTEGFRRSRRGNLWRPYATAAGAVTLTVFPRGDPWAFCIATAAGPEYSADRYDSEADALAALADVFVGWAV
jgi:hypothetical protein